MKLNNVQRQLLMLKQGESFTDCRLFQDAASVGNVETNIKQSAYRYCRLLRKNFGDDFEMQIFNAKNENGYAVFAVITKTAIGASNPFFKQKESYGKRGRPVGTVTGYDLYNVSDL